VHGRAVADAGGADPLGDADAVVCREPGVPVAVVTADCVPILLAAPGARVVAAVHAGWRGLASGVIEAGLRALQRSGARPHELAAAIGPHIGACCYEVDEPVLARLGERFGDALSAATIPTRPGHARVDLGALARAELLRALAPAAVGGFGALCTRCDARFESHRRDGAQAGRMVHWIACAGPGLTPPVRSR
jgi:YfiH family protein